MYIEQFSDYLRLERNYSEKTVLAYRRDLELFSLFLKSLDENLDLTTADRDTVRLWVVELMDKGSATTTVNRKLSTLRSFYRYLRTRGIVKVSPLQSVKGPKNSKPLPQFVKESDMNAILDVDTDGMDFVQIRDLTILETFYETGMRLAELIGLDDKDIDTVSKTIKVTGKRDKQRYIPYSDTLAASLTRYVEARNRAFPRTCGAFFLSPRGERIPRHQVYLLVRKALSSASVSKKSPHVLRHTFATSMLNHDAELGAIRELLGHNSLETTRVYVHTTFQELKDIYKQAHPRA